MTGSGEAEPVQHLPAGGRRWFRVVLAGVLALSALRFAALFASPLELYPDEAQYWLWSRHLAWGYFSKPPVVAWLIALTTAIGGDAEPWVRLSALVLQGLTPLLLFKAGERLYGPREGALAALLYSLMPGVQLGAGVIASDAPLLFCLAGALWAYAALWAGERARERARAAAALGLALGFAFLSKYAAAYFVIGMALHACASPRARGAWRGPALALTLGIALLILAPHLWWSVGHRFTALVHVAGNAAAQRRVSLLHARGALGYIVGQFGVFGPIPFALLVGGAVWLARRRSLEAREVLLLSFVLPPILLVLGEAVLARANANWAAAAYPPACVLVGAWLARWRARRTTWTIAVTQGAFAALFMASAVFPSVADALGLGSTLKTARGRAEQARLVERELARAQRSGPVSAVATDYRFDFNSLAYYDRDLFARPGAPPLRMWSRHDRPLSQADLDSPLTHREGARVLFFNGVKDFARETRADFAAIEQEAGYAIPLDRKRRRTGTVFVGLNFRPRPRDPVTGVPIARPDAPRPASRQTGLQPRSSAR